MYLRVQTWELSLAEVVSFPVPWLLCVIHKTRACNEFEVDVPLGRQCWAQVFLHLWLFPTPSLYLFPVSEQLPQLMFLSSDPQTVHILGKSLETFHSLCISLSHEIKCCHCVFSATLVYLKSEQSSCPRKFKEKADGGQKLFPCQDKKHWPPHSGTCPGCCCFLAVLLALTQVLPWCRQGWEANATVTPSSSGSPEQDACCCWAGSCTGHENPRGWLSLQVAVTCSWIHAVPTTGRAGAEPARDCWVLPRGPNYDQYSLVANNSFQWPLWCQEMWNCSSSACLLWHRDKHL